MFFLSFVIGATITSAIYYIVDSIKPMQSQQDITERVDDLKNALLALALAQVLPHKFESKEYSQYDGMTLPNLSGRSTWQACSSFFNNTDEDHNRVVQKFLRSNFATDEEIRIFFKSYLSHLTRYNFPACKLYSIGQPR